MLTGLYIAPYATPEIPRWPERPKVATGDVTFNPSLSQVGLNIDLRGITGYFSYYPNV
jgi:hypothetical protein